MEIHYQQKFLSFYYYSFLRKFYTPLHSEPATHLGFDSCSEFLFTDVSYGKNVTIFETDMSSSVHVDNKWKDILIAGERRTQRLDDMSLTAEAKYPINVTQSRKRFALSLH